MRRLIQLSAWLAIFVATSTCKSAASDGQIVLHISSTMGNLIDRVELYGELGPSLEGFSVPVATTRFPGSHAILFGGGAMLGPLEVGAIGYRGQTPVVEQHWITSFLSGESRVVHLELSELCAGVICQGEGLTCTPRGCVSDQLSSALLPLLQDELPPVESCNSADDDGDGSIDESFAVPVSENHCGVCNVPCPAGTCDGVRCAQAPVVSLAAGGQQVCALHADGVATCWGSGPKGETGDPLTANVLDADTFDIMALYFGKSRPHGLPMAGVPLAQVEGGGFATCGVSADRRLLCMGDNFFGQLGQLDAGYYTLQAVPSDLVDVTQVSMGVGHTCALLGNGEVRCFGKNASGQAGGLALGMTQVAKERIAIPAATQIAAGGEHSCAVVAGGAVHCWGDNTLGQLGGVGGPAPVVAISSGARMVAAGDAHTCAAMMDGTTRCWGDNSQGQLGTPPGAPAMQPVQVPGVFDLVQIAAAHSHYYEAAFGVTPDLGNHTCGVTSAGAVLCWGDNDYGQLGLDPTAAPQTGATMLVPAGAQQVAAGNSIVCVLFQDGRVRCHGDSYVGMLGDWSIDPFRIVPEGVDVIAP